MKLRAAALSIVATIAATPAMAQYWYAPGPYARPYGGYPPYAETQPYYAPRPYAYGYGPNGGGYDGIAPYQVMAIVRAANLQPISRPWRNGAGYVVRAMDARGGVVRVIVDAYRGRILSIVAAETSPTARLNPDPRVEGVRPQPQYDADGNPLPPRPVPQAVPHVQRPVTEHNRTAAVTPVHPPLPRPRPADAPSPVVAVKPAPDAPAAPAVAPTATPSAPAIETVPQPVETPAGTSGTTGAAPTGAGAGSAFPPVTPLE